MKNHKKILIAINLAFLLFFGVGKVTNVIEKNGYVIGKYAIIKGDYSNSYWYNIDNTTRFVRDDNSDFKVKFSPALGKFKSLETLKVICDSKSNINVLCDLSSLEYLSLRNQN